MFGALAVGVTALSVDPQVITALKADLELLVKSPFMLVTAAVVGLAAAVATWVSAAQEADKSTKTPIESVEESKTAYDYRLLGKQAASMG